METEVFFPGMCKLYSANMKKTECKMTPHQKTYLQRKTDFIRYINFIQILQENRYVKKCASLTESDPFFVILKSPAFIHSHQTVPFSSPLLSASSPFSVSLVSIYNPTLHHNPEQNVIFTTMRTSNLIQCKQVT
jgi:hypothetical protein